jgi:hypothetical protein
MADLSELQSSQAVKIVGSDSTGSELYYVGSTSDGKLKVDSSSMFVSSLNSSDTALNFTEQFTGTWEDVSGYNTITVALKMSTNGILYVQFSPDGVNVDSSLPYTVDANSNEIHRLSITRKYLRVIALNNSGYDQTYLRLQTIVGNHPLITSNLNGSITSDADAIITRSVNVGQKENGEYSNISIDNDNRINTKTDIETLVVLKNILIELKKMNMHLRQVTDIDLDDEEIER